MNENKESCLFCKIVNGQIPAQKVYEDENVLAFLDINPVNPGHTLVIPKKHYADIFDIEEKNWTNVMTVVKKMSTTILNALSPIGINIAMNNKNGAGQVVFHAHVHIMPRFENDGHKLWKGRPYASDAEAEMVLETIRKLIAK